MATASSRAGISWGQALRSPRFSVALLAALAFGAALVLVLPLFFQWIAAKPGAVPSDPLLARLGPFNVSHATFAVLYGTLVLVVARIAKRPMVVLRGLVAYVVLLLLRMASMALVTLEPPAGIIPLVDPVTQVFYPGATPFLKDLFFSGHTATLALMTLLAPRGAVRGLAALGTLAVAVLVLAQHVHWSVDVLAAFPAAWLAWAAGGKLISLLGLSPLRAGA